MRHGYTLQLRVTDLCEGNSPVTGEFPAQRTSNVENVSIWWRHHEVLHEIWIADEFRRDVIYQYVAGVQRSYIQRFDKKIWRGEHAMIDDIMCANVSFWQKSENNYCLLKQRIYNLWLIICGTFYMRIVHKYPMVNNPTDIQIKNLI